MKNFFATAILILAGVILCNTQRAIAKENASIKESSNTETDSYMIDFYPWDGDYDYDFYLQGVYLSADGKNDQICIRPIEFISETETEELAKYGIDMEKEGGSYHIEEYTDEIISLPLKPDTQYHIINWNRDPEMARQSLNHPDPDLSCICALDDPFHFFLFMSDAYGTHLATFPLCLCLDDNGYVDTVIELWLP